MKLLGTIYGVKVYSPKSYSYYKQDLEFLPQNVRKKIKRIARTQKIQDKVQFHEKKISKEFKVFIAKEYTEKKFILKGEDLTAFEVSCQIAHFESNASENKMPILYN
jgi:hypothetical protein